MTDSPATLRTLMAAQLIHAAAMSEFDAATVYAIPAQLEEARRKAHDALDAVLDAKEAHMRAMFGGAG